VEFEKLEIEGAWLATSAIFKDERGDFREWFKAEEVLSNTGLDFKVAQSNVSTSTKGVVRGIHYSLAPVGQAKWVTCMQGKIWDVIVDVRPNSKTFKKWIGIELSPDSGNSVLIGKGLGHAFISLEDYSVVSYQLSSKYSPSEEYEINPFDIEISISWPENKFITSDKDMTAPSLKTNFDDRLLPLLTLNPRKV
jgi:dTDP-4-dehydrorhamnose 3,5-epimerase